MQNASIRRLESWAGFDAQGNVLEVGLTVPMESVEKALVMDGAMTQHEERMDRRRLRMPEVARGQTILDNIDLYYAPMGHGLTRFTKAHDDVHFFSTTPDEAIENRFSFLSICHLRV